MEWHPTRRSWTINGGLAVEVFHRLVDGFGCDVPPANVPLGWGLVWVKLTAQEEKEACTLESTSFFPSLSSINLCIISLLLLTCLSNAELIMTWTPSRESEGLNRTSRITSDLQMLIGTTSF
jgi:hypothetical protein